MTEITLYDGNDHSIALKGSGAQRAVFLSLMEYISQSSKKNIIWGVDEPEAFLQPKLQKKVAEVFKGISSTKNQPIILSTHSPHFINLSDLNNTHLFRGMQEKRAYERKPGVTFFEMNTFNAPFNSDIEKALQIKDHLGIKNNDGWEVLPFNLIVEGEEDKKYLEILFNLMGKPIPNIIWSGGASKIGGYLQYYNMFALDLDFKPVFVCVFDNDNEGREQAKKIHPQSIKSIEAKIVSLPRFDGKTRDFKATTGSDWEIEDFFPPDLILETMNQILRKAKYKKISATQISSRDKPAHIDKGIFAYAEECCSAKNPDKPSLALENEGRKMQLCKIFCEILPDLWEAGEASFKVQKKFINELSALSLTNVI